MKLDKQTLGDLIRLTIFILVTSLATALLVITIGNLSFRGTTTYEAVFSDATGVVKGDDVRIAGVKVGSVKSVEISEDDSTTATVTFSVFSDTELTGATHALIRYRNLVGQRYISLSDGVGSTEPLDDGDTIGIDKTTPALDLTVLFNGFKPLFQALSPDDLNKLSYEVIQVFQGEGGTLESLLSSTASVTSTLADRDQIIGALINNLDYVLDHIADRDDQLSALIISFRNLITGLKNDRGAILGSLDQISVLADQTSSLVRDVRPPFVNDIKQLRRLAGNIDRNKAELDRVLQVLPIKLRKVGRTAIYGSFFNFYLCDFKGKVRLPKLPVLGEKTIPFQYSVNADRCDLG